MPRKRAVSDSSEESDEDMRPRRTSQRTANKRNTKARGVHLNQFCDVCHARYHARTWLNCSKCGIWEHPQCLDPPLERAKLGKWADSWQCSDCKVCAVCDKEGDAAKLVYARLQIVTESEAIL